MKILSIIISIGSIFVGLGIMLRYFFMPDKNAILEGAPAWILAILGAPTTFLVWFTHKIGLDKNIIIEYIWICFFYLLQYQLIALFIFTLYKKNTALLSVKSFVYFGIIIVVIISSAILMQKIILPKP